VNDAPVFVSILLLHAAMAGMAKGTLPVEVTRNSMQMMWVLLNLRVGIANQYLKIYR
jgi:hypothetical protein